MDFSEVVGAELEEFELYAKKYFNRKPGCAYAGVLRLHESICYSALSGGKRFRPTLALLTAQALNQGHPRVLPFALAVEMIHTYSLIHDDLPLMDDDDLRRGKPTNHKIFGEAMALLAGDALLTEAFTHLAGAYKAEPTLAVELLQILGQAAGQRGMVGGQAIDISPKDNPSEEEIRTQHQMKTGALIQASVEGAAVIANAAPAVRKALRQFGEHLGLAFQVADDLQDYDPENEEAASFIAILGLDKTRLLLAQTSADALGSLRVAGIENSRLAEMVKFNLHR
ncbi:MAG: polyprenyl synthetase family protein [Bdellovibrionales bacterium]